MTARRALSGAALGYDQAMTTDGEIPLPRPHSISIVVPVYRGASTLGPLMSEIEPLTTEFATPSGHRAIVAEVVLVYDNGKDDSPAVMRALASRHPFVQTVWLSRNFGQHPTTLAGMASSGGDWIATMDEDGQHDPRSSPRCWMLPWRAGRRRVCQTDQRTATRRCAKHRFAHREEDSSILQRWPQRHRLPKLPTCPGRLGRSVAAYAGPGVYLDVAISWVARRVATCPVELRKEGGRPSGYSLRVVIPLLADGRHQRN